MSDPKEAFIGRRRELAVLEESYKSAKSGFIPVYGRRRVGKSELILYFLKHHPAIYFLGKQAPAGQQKKEFIEAAAAALHEPLLASQSDQSWKQILELVLNRWTSKQKLILVLDEFQWMVEKSPELPSILQELWDRQWQKNGRILLVLCGSYIGFMEREVLGKKSPLFGRRTAQIFLKPFSFREAAAFHPTLSVTAQASIYFICGGVPLYLRFFSSNRSVEQNIQQLLLSEHAPLYAEPDFLLREELREVEKYYAILMALSVGSSPVREIAHRASLPERSLPYYLDNLSDLGYIGRQVPLLGGPVPQRRVRYALLDPLLRFWFRFIYPQESLLAAIGPAKSMDQLIRPQITSYFGQCFEALCREALPILYAQENVSAPFEVGTYWDKKVQIDVVGVRQDGRTDLGECKWGPVPSMKALLQSLDSKAALYPNERGATLRHHLFLRDRPKTAAYSATQVHTLADLYSVA